MLNTGNYLRICSLSKCGFFLLGILFSRAVFLGELYPLGIGFLAGLWCFNHQQKRVVLGGVILGLLISFSGWIFWGYFLSVLLLTILFWQKPAPWLLVPFLIAGTHLLARGIIAWGTGSELYLWLCIIFESILVSVYALVTIVGLEGWEKIKSGVFLTLEESAALGLLVFGLVLGLGNIIWWGYSLQSIFSRWLILWAALWGGPGGGAALGVVVGLAPSVQGLLSLGPLAYYALAGLLGGLFSGFRKLGVVIGFILANVFLSIYFAESGQLLLALKETGVAVCFFCLLNLPIPREVIAAVRDSEALEHYSNTYYADKLFKMAGVFYDLATILPEGLDNQTHREKYQYFIRQVLVQVCQDCSLYQVCWGKKFSKTYRALWDACTRLEQVGCLEESDFGYVFREGCRHFKELLVVLKTQKEVGRMLTVLEQRQGAARQLLKRQLQGLGNIIENFSAEIKQVVEFAGDLEYVLEEKLAAKGIELAEIKVLKFPDKEEIHCTQKSCASQNVCFTLVAPNVSQVLGETFVLDKRDCCGKNGYCSYVLSAAKTVEVVIGLAGCSKSGSDISGDFCAAFSLPQKHFAVVVCDGMGSGVEARAESSLAVNILEKLLWAGISPSIAVKTVNTVLLLKTDVESFTTLDLAIINQINGQCDLIKTGGSPAIIRTPKGIEILPSTSLPVGILEEVEPQIFRQILKPGHNLILMSDGIWDVLAYPDGDWETLLNNFEAFEPQVVADYLFFMAKKAAGGEIADDMCVLVAGLQED
mgnify:CR=1 FL=1